VSFFFGTAGPSNPGAGRAKLPATLKDARRPPPPPPRVSVRRTGKCLSISLLQMGPRGPSSAFFLFPGFTSAALKGEGENWSPLRTSDLHERRRSPAPPPNRGGPSFPLWDPPPRLADAASSSAKRVARPLGALVNDRSRAIRWVDQKSAGPPENSGWSLNPSMGGGPPPWPATLLTGVRFFIGHEKFYGVPSFSSFSFFLPLFYFFSSGDAVSQRHLKPPRPADATWELARAPTTHPLGALSTAPNRARDFGVPENRNEPPPYFFLRRTGPRFTPPVLRLLGRRSPNNPGVKPPLTIPIGETSATQYDPPAFAARENVLTAFEGSEAPPRTLLYAGETGFFRFASRPCTVSPFAGPGRDEDRPKWPTPSSAPIAGK